MAIGCSSFTLAALIAFILINESSSINHVPLTEWNEYKTLHNKEYPINGIVEPLAQYYYAYNKRLIDQHNALYARGQRTYKLKVNQFTDMRQVHFNALFPVATPLSDSNAAVPPETTPAPDSYDPEKNFDFMFNIEDQGFKCNSGWAYAAVKAIEILQAIQTGIVNPPTLSAQNIIDCAASSRACKNQVPQTAYDYLTLHGMDLLTASEYPNNNSQAEPGMCVPRGDLVLNLAEYSTILDGDDESLKAYVAAGFPAVVEINPASFEFMHYAEGVFQLPASGRRKGSHFMVVIGYDTDAASGLDYWILQNSFASTWGEEGKIRVLRTSSHKLAKNTIFPTTLG